MNREALHESLSAIMDNEADELELHRVLSHGSQDAEVRSTWSRYQIARAALHRELMDPKLDLSARISAQLAQEDATIKPEIVSRTLSFSWHSMGRVAIAASVTLAVLAGVRFYNQSQTPERGGLAARSTLAAPATATAAVIPPATPVGVEGKVELQTVSETREQATTGHWQEPKVQQAIQPASFSNEANSVSASRAGR